MGQTQVLSGAVCAKERFGIAERIAPSRTGDVYAAPERPRGDKVAVTVKHVVTDLSKTAFNTLGIKVAAGMYTDVAKRVAPSSDGTPFLAPEEEYMEATGCVARNTGSELPTIPGDEPMEEFADAEEGVAPDPGAPPATSTKWIPLVPVPTLDKSVALDLVATTISSGEMPPLSVELLEVCVTPDPGEASPISPGSCWIQR